MPTFSIIVPVLDEARAIEEALAPLQPLRAAGHEVVVVDGGSRDATVRLAATFADRVLVAERGRALQMNAGAAASRGGILVFLHADTRLPAGALDDIGRALATGDHAWGRFDVRIAGEAPLLRCVAWAMNVRSRLTGIATGDQAIFVRRDAFEAAGRFPPIPLMEDVALASALKRISRPACLRARVTTSGRRWERDGTLRTIVLMWRLRLAYALGADPRRLAHRYGVERTGA